MFWSDNALLGMFLAGDDKKALCMEGSPAEEEREHHGSWWTFLSFYAAYILFINWIKLYEENSTSAKEVDHFVGLDWSYKKSISRLRGKKVLTLKIEIAAGDVVWRGSKEKSGKN